MRLAHFAYFWTSGDARAMRASVERVLPEWSAAVPGYGYVLGMHGFGCEEAGDYALAERQGRAAIEYNPGDLWAVHAVAHLMEMQGRHDEGARWVAQAQTEDSTNFKFHLAWHRALFLLDAGNTDEVIEAYDSKVRDFSSPLLQAQPDLYIDVQNAASLLLRLELIGANVGGRWTELADKAERRIGDHIVLFTVPHWMMALAADGRFANCAALLDAMRDYAARSGASEAEVVAAVAIPAAQAVLAHRRGARNLTSSSPDRWPQSTVSGFLADRSSTPAWSRRRFGARDRSQEEMIPVRVAAARSSRNAVWRHRRSTNLGRIQ